MFSNLNRDQYEEKIAKNSDSVLDILQHAGIAVTWYDNNSGCKGVCDRVPATMLFEQPDPNFCKDDHCFDAILTDRVRQQLGQPLQTKDQLIVLHQLGSHGPEYSKRSEQKHKLFTPECADKQLSNCQQSELINAYDNSIVATDELLANLIQLLQQQSQYRTALLYLSDHGESLGENGVYLHGLPYWMAPKAQTQVPMIWWMSDAYQQGADLSASCLKQQQVAPFSHDYLFHSLLAMYQVQTSVYQSGLDFLAPCRSATAT